MIRKTLASAMVALAVGSSAASATQLIIDPSFGSTENTGATAKVTLSFSESGLDDYMTVLMENTTPAAIGSTLTAVGLELPDFISSVLGFAPGGMDAYFDTLTQNDSVSPGSLDAPGGYDVMITSDGNFEGGSPAGGPTEGNSATVKLNLGDTGMTPAALDAAFTSFYTTADFHVAIGRFQAVGNGLSDKVIGGVPEPASLCLLGLGGFALLRRRASR